MCNNTLNLVLEKAKRSWSTIHTGNLAGKINENDNNAIRVENEKAELLGYVPRYYAEAFVRLMVE